MTAKQGAGGQMLCAVQEKACAGVDRARLPGAMPAPAARKEGGAHE